MPILQGSALPVPAAQPFVDRNGIITIPWFRLLQTLFERSGGSSGDASTILDTLGSTRGGMLARFASTWAEFVSVAPNHIPVMSPGVDVVLKSAAEIMDFVGNTHGGILARQAAAWVELTTALTNQVPVLSTGADVSLKSVPGLLDLIGNTHGGILARQAAGWEELIAGSNFLLPVVSVGVDVNLASLSQILDLSGNTQGDIIYRGAATWDALAPSNGKFLQSQGAGSNPVWSTPFATTATGVVAAGANQATAFQLTKQWNVVATVAAATGVLLADLGTGIDNRIWNTGANALNIYPPVGHQIDALGVNVAYPLPVNKNQTISKVSATQWQSDQPG